MLFGRASFPNGLPFCAAVLLRGAGTDLLSLEKSRRGEAFIFFPHEVPSVRKSAKLESSERMYFKLFSQASREVMVSFEVSDHCFGALCEVIATVKFTS